MCCLPGQGKFSVVVSHEDADCSGVGREGGTGRQNAPTPGRFAARWRSLHARPAYRIRFRGDGIFLRPTFLRSFTNESASFDKTVRAKRQEVFPAFTFAAAV